MVLFKIEKGRKGSGDRIIRVWAYGEIFTFRDILYMLDVFFKSENSIYPISEGYQGKCMLLKAILEVYSGIPLEKVLKRYGLKREKEKTVKVFSKVGVKA